MTFVHPFFRAALLVACSAASAAQGAPRDPAGGPAAANAAVPATSYQPLLPYRPAAPERTTPDQNWKALNRTVAGYNSMSLTMGGMDGPATAAGTPADPAAASTGEAMPAGPVAASPAHAMPAEPAAASAGQGTPAAPVATGAGHGHQGHGAGAHHHHGERL